MNFLEKDLEEIIWNDYQLNGSNNLADRGLFISGKLKRQLNIGGYGISDLVSFERGFSDLEEMVFYENEYYKDFKLSNPDKHFEKCLRITVYELKKEKIGISAYLQAVKYVRGIQQYLALRHKSFNVFYEIVLIGRKLDDSGSFCFLPNVVDNLSLITYEYGIDGLVFQKNYGYRLINNCFNINKKQ